MMNAILCKVFRNEFDVDLAAGVLYNYIYIRYLQSTRPSVIVFCC